MMLGRSGNSLFTESASVIALALILLGFWLFISSGEANGLTIAGIGLLVLSVRSNSILRYSGFLGVLLIIFGIFLSLGWR